MNMTPIGVVTLVLAMLLFRRSPGGILMLTLFMMVFGAAAALLLPSLGGASVPPTRLAIMILLARLFIDPGSRSLFARSASANLPLVAFAAYAMLSAVLLPRLFAGQLYVVGQRPLLINGFVVAEPLGPSSANVTQLFYILSTAFGFFAAEVVSGDRGIARRISNVMIWVGLAHVAFGIIDQVAYYAHLGDILGPLRNATYAEVAPQLFSSGVKRISGSFPEPSSYATFGFPVAVFLVEWWLRRPRAPWAAITAALVIFMILLSTASTGYVSLAGYAVCLAIRGLRGPTRGHQMGKVLAIVAFTATTGTIAMALAVLKPDQAQMWADLVNQMTFGKAGSSSAAERLSWAQQGWSAFQISNGLGVGVGSFRSSSLFMALIGTVGVPGCLALALQVALIAWPRRRGVVGNEETDSLVAASQWTALLSLLPLAISGATPDPGLVFAIFGGLAGAAPRRALLGHPVKVQGQDRWPEPTAA